MEIKLDKPPYGNTGAQNTHRNGLRACVDWVQATFTSVKKLENIFYILGLEIGNFEEMETGQYGYKTQLRFGHIKVYYDGKEGMGFHLEMSGQGCREYEQLVPDNWFDLFWAIRKYGHFTRLDIALDDFEGYFTVKQLKKLIKLKRCRSKFRKGRSMEEFELSNGEDLGQTLYVGSAKSRLQIRFYDKLAERIAAGKIIEEGLDHWVRTEIQLRDERADSVADYFLDNPNEALKNIIRGILANYINFLDKTEDTNKARWSVAKFWLKYLDNAEKLRLTQVAPDRTVESIMAWHERQVEASLAVIWQTHENVGEWLVDSVNRGHEKLTKKHWAIVDSYNSLKIKKPIQNQLNEHPRQRVLVCNSIIN